MSQENLDDETLDNEVLDNETFSFAELTNLISLRQYVSNSIDNAMIDRKTVKYLSGVLILIDKKLLGLLQSDSFKDYINYTDVNNAILDAVRVSNIKSSLNK